MRWTAECHTCWERNETYDPEGPHFCQHCGASMTYPYFSDGQLNFILLALVIGCLVVLGCIMLVTSG